MRDRPAAFRAACGGMAPLALSADDNLSRAPRGFEDVVEPDLASAVRMRSLVFRQPVRDEQVFSPRLVAEFLQFAGQAAPFLRFCWNALDRVPMDERETPRVAKARV